MAVEYGWTGFENGNADAGISPSPVRGTIIGVNASRPRTGVFCFSDLSGDNTTNAWFAYSRKNTALGTGLPIGGIARAKVRIFFRIMVTPGTSDCAVVGQGTASNGGFVGHMAIMTTRQFRVWSFNNYSAPSTAVLAFDTWYRADLTHTTSRASATDCGTSTTCSVYTEDGVLVDTVSTGSAVVGSGDMPRDAFCGNGSGFFSTCHNDFDDWWWGVADGADAATIDFPPDPVWRITHVAATAQGGLADWTGDFRTVTDRPMQTVTTDEQSAAATIGLTTTFVHAAAASLGIGNIHGVLVAGQLRSITSSGDEAFLLGGVEYTVPVTTIFPGQPRQTGVTYDPAGVLVDHTTFNGWEFGAVNKRGTGLRLAQIYLEVLHDGTSQPSPYTDVSDTFRLNIITYTGNGTYQTIAGMGFGAQVLLIKPFTGGLNSGGFRLARHGGTRAHSSEAGGAAHFNGILSITDDGFNLGPNVNVNASGVLFVAIGIRDGGQGDGGFHLSSLSRCGSGLDNYDVPFPEGFQPDFAYIHAPGQAAIFRSSAMVGDVTIGLAGPSTLPNFIQQFNPDGYQVGSGSQANIQSGLPLSIIMRIGTQLTFILHVGTLTPAGSSATITGIPFMPVFVCCQRQGNPSTAFWRCSLGHAGATSTQWSNGNTSATAITAITADGFTIGSSLATAGTPVFWFALSPGFIPPPPCAGIAQSRQDGLPYVPTPGQVCAGDGLVDGPRTGT